MVEPGIVLDELNRQLRHTGLWFPVDVSTSTRATIGGMAGNNSCGTRSIRYGIMRDNVLAIDALLADGTEARFAEVGHNLAPHAPPEFSSPLWGGVRGGGIPYGQRSSLTLLLPVPPPPGGRGRYGHRRPLPRPAGARRREAAHIAQAFPEVSRRVGGYLIDALLPGDSR